MRSPAVVNDVLGQAAKDYLEAIYELQMAGGRAATSAVARRLGVSDPSATRMIRRLASLRLLDHTPYHGATLTPEGEALARWLIRRRDLIEQYLIQYLGYPAGEAGADARRLQCAVSETFEHRIGLLLRGWDPDPDCDAVSIAKGHGTDEIRLTSEAAGPGLRPRSGQADERR